MDILITNNQKLDNIKNFCSPMLKLFLPSRLFFCLWLCLGHFFTPARKRNAYTFRSLLSISSIVNGPNVCWFTATIDSSFLVSCAWFLQSCGVPSILYGYQFPLAHSFRFVCCNTCNFSYMIDSYSLLNIAKCLNIVCY